MARGRRGPHGPHRVADIAQQAGVSAATVDRVLHGRAGVSARAVSQVEQALLELDRQQTQLRLAGRTLLLDLVMLAPSRFSAAVRKALEQELPGLRPATVRARFHLRERGAAADLVDILDRLSTRGPDCQGLLLKAPDDPGVVEAVNRLVERRIPVVTLVTDLQASRRTAYVGLDNAAAGDTAAYLLQQWLGRRRGAVLVTLSRSTFFGEQERLAGFEATLARVDPTREVIVLSDADGLDEGMTGLVRELLRERRDLAAVYSIGGGNLGIRGELDRAGVHPHAYLAHDLDEDNAWLLRAGGLSAVLHHDLRSDLRLACEQVLRFHHLLPGAPTSWPAPVQVVTPFNVPSRLGGSAEGRQAPPAARAPGQPASRSSRRGG
ncbi:LacI family DNA-binding transcriptional regulator [Segeticoccus rhizosphaerae]|uniref:LacI family DNA-binding transcriptional regulator n=1 Tax=Segeticoccus rhizosphaerae TaxID=1104777 RepID=UPI0010C12E24|nr:LacI family DNA-binding transcriptional regulator [Ornithinicoccus soli]